MTSRRHHHIIHTNVPRGSSACSSHGSTTTKAAGSMTMISLFTDKNTPRQQNQRARGGPGSISGLTLQNQPGPEHHTNITTKSTRQQLLFLHRLRRVNMDAWRLCNYWCPIHYPEGLVHSLVQLLPPQTVAPHQDRDTHSGSLHSTGQRNAGLADTRTGTDLHISTHSSPVLFTHSCYFSCYPSDLWVEDGEEFIYSGTNL